LILIIIISNLIYFTNFLHNVICFTFFFSKITVRMNVISLGTARGEYEIQMLGERIECGGYIPFSTLVQFRMNNALEMTHNC
jgi:hypothetical protein